jgi:hypothetical protein
MKPLLVIALVAAALTIGTAKPASATMAAAPAIHYGETDAGIVQQVGHRYYGNRHYGNRHYGYRNYGYGYGYGYRPYGYYGGYRPGLSLRFGY